MCGFSRADCGVEGLGERTASMFIFGVEICGPVGNGERYPNVCEQVTLEFWRIPQPQITEIGSCAADIAEEIFILGIEIRRSEERRVGKECLSTCKSRGSPSHKKTKKKKNKQSRE